MTDLQLLVIHCEKRHQETLVYPIRCNTCDRPFIFQEALLHHQKVTEHFNLDFTTPTSTPDVSISIFSTMNSSTMNFSTMNFSSFWLKSSWLKSLWLNSSWLKNLRLKSSGLKCPVIHQKTEHGQEIDTLHCDLCTQDFFAKARTTLLLGLKSFLKVA